VFAPFADGKSVERGRKTGVQLCVMASGYVLAKTLSCKWPMSAAGVRIKIRRWLWLLIRLRHINGRPYWTCIGSREELITATPNISFHEMQGTHSSSQLDWVPRLPLSSTPPLRHSPLNHSVMIILGTSKQIAQ
jgi:hypothetical protein